MAASTTLPAIPVMEPHAKKPEKQQKRALARLLGPTVAGLVEQVIFHPVDTAAKRLMFNTELPIFTKSPFSFSGENLSKVVFRDAHNEGWGTKYTSMFPGLGFAFGFKVLQRVYKFGGQPYANELVDRHLGSSFDVFSEKYRKPMMHAASGSLIGIGEILLLPFDILKIKSQTNPDSLKGRGLFQILRQEKISTLYKGWGWTAARNAPGSFALFGANAFVKERVFHMEDYSKATFFQNFVASSAGGVASIIVASPLDVVKTRLQSRSFDSKETGVQVITNLVRKEGPTAFFKGLTPKLLVVGPKLIFSFTLAQSLISMLEKRL